MNDIIKNRRSIRKFKPAPVTREQLDALLEAAMHAPTARNARAFEFVAVTNRELLDEVAKESPNAGMCAEAPAAIIVVAVPALEKSEGYFPQDCSAATMNILTEAVSLGLGTCWCGIYPREERQILLRKLFGIDEAKIPFCIIAVGVPDEEPEAKGFFEPSKVRYI